MADTLKEAELLLEIQRKAQQIKEKDLELQAAQATGAQDLIDKAKLELDFLEQKKIQHENNLALESSSIQFREQSLQLLNDEATALQQQIDATSDITTKKQLQIELDKISIKSLEKELEIAKNREIIDQSEIDSIMRGIELSNKSISQQEQELTNEKKLNEESEKRIEKAKQYLNALTGGMLQSVASMRNMEGVAAGFGERLKEVVNANQQFASTTGQLATDFGNLFSGTTGLEQFGIRSTDLQKNFSELYTSMAGFNSLSLENQKILTENASKMANLGFSVQESAVMYNLLEKSLGMSTTEIAKTQNELARTAQAAGIAPSKMLKDFASAMPQLAAYGKQSVQVFKELQLQAKSLGVEMSTLTATFGEAFDTFEGSADKVGKLNSILGGDYLNSVELLNATESERVELIKMAIEASGKNFDSMDKFQKKSIAASLGIKDINEANKIFGITSAEMRAKTAIQAAEQERLDKIQKESADVVKQLKGAFDEMLIAVKPVVGLFKDFIMLLVNNPWLGQLVTFIGLLAVLTKAFIFIASPITSFIALFKGAGGAANRSGSMMAGVIGRIGAAAKQNAAGLITLGQVFLMVATGVAIAAAGIGFLVSAFDGLNTEQLQAVKEVLFGLAMGFAVIGIALLGIALAAPLLAPGVLILKAFGLAVLLIGAGIGIAAGGMSLFVNSLGNISANAAGLGSVLASLGTIATLGTIGGIALIAGTAVIVKAIGMLRDAINELPEEKSIKVTSTMNSINSLLTTAKSLKAEEIRPATEFVTAVKQYYEVQATSKDAKDDALFNSLQKLLAPAKGATEKTSSQAAQTINLEVKLDGETIARKILEINAGSVIA